MRNEDDPGSSLCANEYYIFNVRGETSRQRLRNCLFNFHSSSPFAFFFPPQQPMISEDEVPSLNDTWFGESLDPILLVWCGFSPCISARNFVLGIFSKEDLNEITIYSFFFSLIKKGVAKTQPHLSLNMQISLAAVEPQRLF